MIPILESRHGEGRSHKRCEDGTFRLQIYIHWHETEEIQKPQKKSTNSFLIDERLIVCKFIFEFQKNP